ncbi:MAG: hypothetical protein JO319_06590 [Acidobacteriaceae bacterium]|nr:hypothetical protein [Acidobacteriaceae bacterium]
MSIELRKPVLGLIVLSALLVPGTGSAQTTLGTVTYQDRTGAAAPEQNLRFSALDGQTGPMPSGLNYRTNRVLNAAGQQVAWQAMSNGDLMVRTSMPASKFPFTTSAVTRAGNTLNFFDLLESACLPNNSAVEFLATTGSTLPSPLAPGVIYYVNSCSDSASNFSYTVSSAYNGLPLTLTTAGSGTFFMEYVPFVVSGSALLSGGHRYVNGDTLEFAPTDSGTLPAGMAAGTLYFVCNASTDTFQISTTPDCTHNVTVTSSGTAVPQILSTKIWTLQSGAPTTATQLNGTQVVANGNYWELSNGLTGIRIPTLAYQQSKAYGLAPIQALKLADGTWTPAVGKLNYDNSGIPPQYVSPPTIASPSVPTGYSTVFTENGMLEIALQASVTVNRGLHYGSTFSPSINFNTNTFSGGISGTPYAFFVASSAIPSLKAGAIVYATNVVKATSFQVAATPNGSPISLGSSGSVSFSLVTQEPGTGFYRVTATIDANTKAIQILEDHNIHDYNYSLNLRPNLVADTGRFRTTGLSPLASNNFGCAYVQIPETGISLNGSTLTINAPSHGITGASPQIQLAGTVGIANANNQTFTATVVDANTLRVTCGNCTGSTGSGGYVRSQSSSSIPEVDLFVDLLGADRFSGPGCASYSIRALGSQYPPNNVQQTGWYWMLYNSQGASTSNAVGLFLGKGSQQYMAEMDPHGPGVYDAPSTSSQGFTLWDTAVSSTQTYYTGEIKRPFGFWISTNADVLPAAQVQPISVVRNSLAGINLSKINSYILNFPDPANGWPYLYLSDSGAAQLQSLLSNGTPLCGSSNCLSKVVQSDANQQPLAQFIADNTPARAAYSTAQLTKQLQAFANGFYTVGNLDNTLLGYQGAYPCPRNQALANLVLKSAIATQWQKQVAKSFLAYCACFLWDTDFESSDPSVSYGLANQQSQFLQEQSQIAAQIYTHPLMSTLYAQSVQNIESNVLGSLNSSGSGYASWHYQSAATQLGLFGWLTLTNNATGNASNIIAQHPAVPAFGEWYLSGITPPEVRYGNTRMYISDGDGNTEPETDPGLLATLLKTASPTLASSLEYIWQSQGLSSYTVSSFFAPSLMALDFTIPPVDPQLTSQHIAGYHSMLRSGWNTAYENAVDFLYGGFYSAQGHAHTDTGRVAAYLLGAPISIDWNPNLYYPEVTGRFQHSTVCLDSELTPSTWSQANVSLNACGTVWNGSQSQPDSSTQLLQTATFTGSSSATASWTKPLPDGTIFQRSVTLLNYDPKFAVLHVNDSFSCANQASSCQSQSGKTLTWNLMAASTYTGSGNNMTGSGVRVSTPNGSYIPTPALNLSNNGVLPSSGPVYTLSGNGVQQFAFTGMPWSNHVAGGVDFDLYTQSAGGYQFLIGNWCNSENNNNTNNCALESQDVLRLHGNKNFDTWIVARPKGTADPTVTLQGCGIQIALTGTLCFDQTYSQYDDGAGTQTLATYDGSSHSAFGMSISGSPAECVRTTTSISCTAQAWTPGLTSVSLPGAYYVQQAAAYDNYGNVILFSANGAAEKITLSTTPVTLRQISLTAPGGAPAWQLRFVTPPLTSTSPFLTQVGAGQTASIKGPPGTYTAQWVSGNMQSQPFTVVVR